jgi:hypothetical protein
VKSDSASSGTLSQKVVSLGESLAGNLMSAIVTAINGQSAIEATTTSKAVFAVPDTLFGEPGALPPSPSFWQILRDDLAHVAMWIANSIDALILGVVSILQTHIARL